MKKTLFFGLMVAATLGFTSCGNDDEAVLDEATQQGMVLRATVEQPAEARAIINASQDVWKFEFTKDDNVSVTNTAISKYYTFTNDGTQFKSADAKAEDTNVTWYAYFPSHTIDLTNQSGNMTDVPSKYALAGETASVTTGKDGLSITMSPKVAILVINNQKGAIDINVKTSETDWVSGLTAADADGFGVTTSTSRQNLLSVETAKVTYYVVVPAGVPLSVKNGDTVVKSTKGLAVGHYYELTVE